MASITEAQRHAFAYVSDLTTLTIRKACKAARRTKQVLTSERLRVQAALVYIVEQLTQFEDDYKERIAQETDTNNINRITDEYKRDIDTFKRYHITVTL